MVTGQKAPPGHFSNQAERDWLIVGQLPGPFACPVCSQSCCEVLDGLIPRVDTQMISESSKMDDILLAPVCWHPPRDPLLCLRQSRTQCISDLIENRLHGLRLCRNIVVY